MTSPRSVELELRRVLDDHSVLPGTSRTYLSDATVSRNLRGRADAVALPSSTAAVAAVVGWCYEHDVPMIPRGGGSGLAGGAVPLDGGVVISLERLTEPPIVEPELWRAKVSAGTTTAHLRRRAREEGLLYPPDPGAAEQSHIGGNIATNAGGPHTFKYGVTGAWVTGIELVLPVGETVRFGGPTRKDVAGYDLRSLVVGSEGTLGIVTSAWVKLTPAPELTLPVMALYPSAAAGCEALAMVLGSGILAAAIEFLDEPAVAAAISTLPGERPEGDTFMLIAEADGAAAEAQRIRDDLVEVLREGASVLYAPTARGAIDELWRWRAGVSLAVTAGRGGKVSEDIVVPVEHLAEAIAATREIGIEHGLPACSWGHAGDGNLHSTFMVDLEDPAEMERAETAAEQLFALADRLGGSISGEHGIGIVKGGALGNQWPAAAVGLHDAIKRSFDPKGLLNPGKKLPVRSELLGTTVKQRRAAPERR